MDTKEEQRVESRITIHDPRFTTFQPVAFSQGGMMKFNVTALALTVGLFWGAAILIVGAASLIWPGYGRAFLELAASIYPGYHPGPAIGSVITGTLYGLVDGAIGGAVFGWLYNLLSRRA